MKPRSSLGLFAVGWYLLMPPFCGWQTGHSGSPLAVGPSGDLHSLSDCSDERDRQLKNVAQEAQQINTEHEQSSDVSEGDQFSFVEQTVGASKSSEEPGLQATELRPAKTYHPWSSHRHGKKPRAH
jgi:hypothetical protein